MLPAKARRIVGIVLLSVGIFLSIIGLLLMKLFEGADNGLGGIGELIWLILLGLGIISMVVSISFFRKYDLKMMRYAIRDYLLRALLQKSVPDFAVSLNAD